MKTFGKAFSLLVILLIVNIACKTQAFPTQTKQQSTQKSVSYEVLLGKSITDQAVIDFIVQNNCSPADKFRLCKEVGMALWTDTDLVVKTIYLYAGHADGFKRYHGEMPLGLSFYDPMWRVQEKLKNVNTDNILQQAGLPDATGSPDHIHYWAIYKRFNITVIYNSPFADEDAYIYAVLVSS